jgi:hypothetical protein
VMSFRDVPVPFELIYTHRMPDNNDEVPCATRARGCDRVHRELSRSHAQRPRLPVRVLGDEQGGRASRPRPQQEPATPPAQRKVAVTSGAVAGMSEKVDLEDRTRARRSRQRSLLPSRVVASRASRRGTSSRRQWTRDGPE